MIQRIQTVYLLVVAILAVVMISLPVGSFVTPDYHMSELTNLALVSEEGVSDYAPWALFALQTVSAILALVTIFLYKKRMLQIRLTLFNMLVLVGYYVTGHFRAEPERRCLFRSVMDCMSATDFDHSFVAGYPCHRQGRNAGKSIRETEISRKGWSESCIY